MEKYLAEFVGTAILILLGDGVVANVVLKKTYGNNAGTLFITTAWAFAVFIPAVITGWMSGAHFNPALTIALAVCAGFDWSLVPGYIVAQILGGFTGAWLVYFTYKKQFDTHDEPQNTRGIFCTAPTVRDYFWNGITELIGAFILVFAILGMDVPQNGLVKGLGSIYVAFLIWVIGMSLGGPTGYAINPARDLGPRLAYALLPIKGKSHPDWAYSWVPVVFPIIGAVLGGVSYKYLSGFF